MSPRPDVVTSLTDNYCKIACLAGRCCEKTRWVGVARLARRCRIQKNETLNTTTTHVHCTKSIGCTAQQFVPETLQASHPKKNFTVTDRISRKHLLSTFRWCLCEGYDDCQHERQHNLPCLFVVFVKERTMFGERDQALTVI